MRVEHFHLGGLAEPPANHPALEVGRVSSRGERGRGEQWSLPLVGTGWLQLEAAPVLGMRFSLLFKLPLLAADVVTAALLWKVWRKRGEYQARRVGICPSLARSRRKAPSSRRGSDSPASGRTAGPALQHWRLAPSRPRAAPVHAMARPPSGVYTLRRHDRDLAQPAQALGPRDALALAASLHLVARATKEISRENAAIID